MRIVTPQFRCGPMSVPGTYETYELGEIASAFWGRNHQVIGNAVRRGQSLDGVVGPTVDVPELGFKTQRTGDLWEQLAGTGWMLAKNVSRRCTAGAAEQDRALSGSVSLHEYGSFCPTAPLPDRNVGV